MRTIYKKVDYNPAGDSFISSASFISSQYSKNMMAIPSPNALSKVAYLGSFPGLKLWSSGASLEPDRGIYNYLFQNKAWKVSGNTLYSFDSNGTQTAVGTIPGTDLCDIKANDNTLLICNGAGLYSCDGSTVTALSPGFTAVSLDYLNKQFIVSDTDSICRISDVGSTTFNSDNTFLAESQQDEVVAVKVFNQFLFLCGSKTIEPSENTGVGNPPVSRLNGAIIEDTGLLSRTAITNTRSSLYFLGANRIPYRLINFQSENLSEKNPGIAQLFRSYNANCFLSSFIANSQEIVAFCFPTDKKVWCFSELTGLWFQLDHDTDDQLWLGKTSAYLFDKQLIGDRANGNIYELDAATYQNNSVPMVRERVFRPLSGEMIAGSRDYFKMRMIQFAVETGVGVGDDNPQMQVSYSTDNYPFSNEHWLSLGRTGEYLKFVEDYSNKRFKSLVVKVRYTENTRFSIGAAGIYVRMGVR